ncbi:hypothetical protein PG996_008389 [Apiospora saccharicola]|uniref:Zn(2)-C6 fungal-type domain-containing protein n=1 Tax=Apiospora saccharicola TaxID=335842 RepID=A0ABR1UXS4_9PEZI
MAPGPFDARVKRSRCTTCSTSHLKCNNRQPCSHCERRGSPCVYPPSTLRTIRIEQGKHKTPTSFPRKRDVILLQCAQPDERPLLKASPSSSPSTRYFYYFDVFVQKNVFAPNVPAYNLDVQRLLGTGPEEPLHYAVVALGALQSSKAGLFNIPAGPAGYDGKLPNTTAPRRVLDYAASWDLRDTADVWKLMNGETGDGWLMHMVHGTANALQAAGPLACQSGLGLTFFLQARIFEASRALLLGEASFLSNPEWGYPTRGTQSPEGSLENACLDEILGIIVQCSKLRAEVVQLLERIGSSHADQTPTEAPGLAAEGIHLRQRLELWRATNPCLPIRDSPNPCNPARGAEVAYPRGELCTALHAASYNGDEEVVQWLLEKGADVNEPGVFGFALNAASSDRIVQLLLTKGAIAIRR